MTRMRSIVAAAAAVVSLCCGMNSIAQAPNCPVSCQPQNGAPFIPEGEPCPTTSVNCGCDCAAETYLQLRCPEGYCGTTWAMGGQQDTDWYNVHVNDNNNDGTEQVCFQVNSDVPIVVELYSGNCGGLT